MGKRGDWRERERGVGERGSNCFLCVYYFMLLFGNIVTNSFPADKASLNQMMSNFNVQTFHEVNVLT